MNKKVKKLIKGHMNLNIYYIYSLLFILMIIVVFYQFISTGTSLIWRSDVSYNFKTMVYVSRYFKQIFNNIFVAHQLKIPQFDFAIWEGYDILHAMHYPSLGDPFCFFSFIIPEKMLYIYYEFVAILKIYLAGIGFINLMQYKKVYNDFALLAGTYIYIFSFYSMFNVARHLCFLSGIMYMPFIILGCEYIFDNKKPYLFIISVFLIAISNIFFFYQIVLMVVIYVIVKSLYLYKFNLSLSFFIVIGKFALYSFISLLMASIVLLPMLKVMLTDIRIHLDNYFFYLYPPYYYKSLITDIFTHSLNFWTCLGFSSPCIVSVLLLFYKRKNYTLLFIYFVIAINFMLFPIFGKAFNGFAYITNRWSWLLALLIGAIVSLTFNDILCISERNFKFILCGILIYIFCLFYFGNNKSEVYLQVCIILIYLIVILYIKNFKRKSLLLLLLNLVSIFIISFFFFSPKYRNYISECIKQNEVNDFVFDNEGKDIATYEINNLNNEYYRYSGTYHKDRINNYLNNVSSTAHYFPISNAYATNFLKKLAMSISRNFFWISYDEKVIINELASVKYFVSGDEKDVPYGFRSVKEYSNYKLYENEYFLPVLYTYYSVLNENESLKLNYPCRQELMMKSAIVRNYSGNINSNEPQISVFEIPISFKLLTKDVFMGDNYFLAYRDNQKIELNINGKLNSENYCYLENLNYLRLSDYEMYNDKNYLLDGKYYDIDPLKRYPDEKYVEMTSSQKRELLYKKLNMNSPSSSVDLDFLFNGHSKKLKVVNNRDAGYAGLHNFLMNLGYNRDIIKKVVITLPKSGLYTFDDIKYYCDDLTDYEHDVMMLKSGNITNINVGNDKVTAYINSDLDKYVCAAIPYSDGWKAYVDGKETPVYLTNYYHMGIDVPKGKHEIKFVYNNKFIFYGRVLTILGFIIFIGIIVCDKKYKLFY